MDINQDIDEAIAHCIDLNVQLKGSGETIKPDPRALAKWLAELKVLRLRDQRGELAPQEDLLNDSVIETAPALKAPACDQDVFKNGSVVAILDARTVVAEAIVESVRLHKGFSLDWHYAGGRAIFKTLESDLEAVREALESAIPTIMR
jgi:hypothetical protein